MSALRATVLGLFAGLTLLLFGASFALLMSSVFRAVGFDLTHNLYGIGISVLQAGVICTWLYALHRWISRRSFPSGLYRAACASNVLYCVALLAWTQHFLGDRPLPSGSASFLYFSAASAFVGVFVAYDRRRDRKGPGMTERIG